MNRLDVQCSASGCIPRRKKVPSPSRRHGRHRVQSVLVPRSARMDSGAPATRACAAGLCVCFVCVFRFSPVRSRNLSACSEEENTRSVTLVEQSIAKSGDSLRAAGRVVAAKLAVCVTCTNESCGSQRWRNSCAATRGGADSTAAVIRSSSTSRPVASPSADGDLVCF